MMRKRLGIVLGSCALALAACGGGDSTSDTSVLLPDESTTTTVASDATIDADNVLLALALLETGDIDAAIAEGLVNPDEVDAAVGAVADGTVDLWLERADGR